MSYNYSYDTGALSYGMMARLLTNDDSPSPKEAKLGLISSLETLKHDIAVSELGIKVGCQSWKTFAEFEKNYKEVAKKHGYTDEECKILFDLVKAMNAAVVAKIKNKISVYQKLIKTLKGLL